MLLIVLTFVMDNDGGQVLLFGASATWVGEDARDESVSVRTCVDDTEKEAQSGTDDLSL